MSKVLTETYDVAVKNNLWGLSYFEFVDAFKNTPNFKNAFYKTAIDANVDLPLTFDDFESVINSELEKINITNKEESIAPFYKSPTIAPPGMFEVEAVAEQTKVAKAQTPLKDDFYMIDLPYKPLINKDINENIPRSNEIVNVLNGVKETFKNLGEVVDANNQSRMEFLKGNISYQEYRKNLYSKSIVKQRTGTDRPLSGIMEPLMKSLETKDGQFYTNIFKETVALFASIPHLLLSLKDDLNTGDYTKTTKELGAFYAEMYSDYIKAFGPMQGPDRFTKQYEARRRIFNHPVQYTLGLMAPLSQIKTVKKAPVTTGPDIWIGDASLGARKKIADIKAKEIISEVAKDPTTFKEIIMNVDDLKTSGKMPEVEGYVNIPKNITNTNPEIVIQSPNNLKKTESVEAQRFDLFLKKSHVDAESMGSNQLSIKSKILQNFNDMQSNVKRELIKKGGKEGSEAVMYYELMAGTSARAALMSQKFVDRVYAGLNKQETKLLNEIIRAKRTNVIEKSKPLYKPGEYINRGDANIWLNEQSKTPAYNRLNQRAETYFEIFRSELGRLKKEGIIDVKTFEDLLKFDYSPTQWLEKIDPDINYKIGGETISLTESGIKKLKEGAEGTLELNGQRLLESTVSINDARISRNRANKALYDLAKSNPENGIVLPAIQIKPGTYKNPPKGYTEMPVRIDGKTEKFYMKNEMAKEWVSTVDPVPALEAAGFALGTPALRAFATGYNPEFALTNFPRDIAHIFLTTKEYSSFAPKFLAQIGRDIKTVAKDALSKKGRFEDFVMEGGGMSFMSHMGQTQKFKGTYLGKGLEYLGYLGETTEIITRLALRERALRNGKNNIEATHIARNYLDFSQGGRMTKTLNNLSPYLNASMQGTRGVLRAFKNDPALASYKVSQLMGLQTSLSIANRAVNPEAYDAISDRDKVNNFIFTTPLYRIDEKGEKRYYYFRVAKDQSQRLFATAADALLGRKVYNMSADDAFSMMGMALADAIPIGAGTFLPPVADGILGHVFNKDFWRNEDIWKGREFPTFEKSQEYTPKTSPVFKFLGKTTSKMGIGLSPARLEYQLSQITTNSNMYLDVVGAPFKYLFNEIPDDEEKDQLIQQISDKWFIRKVLKETPPKSLYVELKRANKKLNVIKAQNDREYRDRFQKYKIGEAKLGYVTNWIKGLEMNEFNRIHSRFQKEMQTKNLDLPRFWNSIRFARVDDVIKAQMYFQELQKIPVEKRKELESERKKIRDLQTPKFTIEFKKLVKNYKLEL